MKVTNTYTDVIASRRALVAELRCKGLAIRAIVVEVANAGYINPDTGEPFSRDTIHNDIKAMRETWAEDIIDHAARQFAEIKHIKYQAMRDGEWALALKALDREMRLLGTNAPQKLDISLHGVDTDLIHRLIVALRKANMHPDTIFRRMIERVQGVVDSGETAPREIAPASAPPISATLLNEFVSVCIAHELDPVRILNEAIDIIKTGADE